MTAVLFAVFVALCALALAWIDGRRIALRDAKIDQITVARNADRTEWMTTYATMRAELDALRCDDLDAFHDGELDPARAEAFRLHLATCARCDAGLLDLAQIEVAIRDAKPDPTRTT